MIRYRYRDRDRDFLGLEGDAWRMFLKGCVCGLGGRTEEEGMNGRTPL